MARAWPAAARAIVRAACAWLAFAAAGAPAAHVAQYLPVPGGSFASVVAGDASGGQARVADFLLRDEPVTRGEFARFVVAHPEWSRDSIARVFADSDYLSDTARGAALSEGEAAQPVVHVSWFAAQAYCKSEGARLPTWNEWEYAAAADETRRDARGDPQWRERILSWYAHPAGAANASVGGPANVYGLRDLHGLVWEWVDDFNALLVDADSRAGSDPDKLKFCGAGAISLRERENYAILMRVALLSSLKATDGTASLGFRCARPAAREMPRDSVFRLDASFTDQTGRIFGLGDHRGSPMLVSMFYTSCEFVCPMLVETIKATEDRLAAEERRRLRVLLVSFDPARDTLAVLRRTAQERHVDGDRWQLARTEAADVRRLAAMLDISYRALDNGDFNHSAAIVLVDGEGRILGRSTDLSGPDDAFVALVRRTLAASRVAGPPP